MGKDTLIQFDFLFGQKPITVLFCKIGVHSFRLKFFRNSINKPNADPECELTDEEEDHTVHESSNASPATRSTTATPQPHEPSPLAAITNAYCGRLTPSSSRSFASISGPSGVISSRQSSPRNSIDSRSLLLAAFGGDVRRLRGSQKSQPATSVEPLSMGGGIERFDRSNSSRSVGGSRSPRFPFRHMTSSVKSSTNSPPATGRGSGSGPASGGTPGTPTGLNWLTTECCAVIVMCFFSVLFII